MFFVNVVLAFAAFLTSFTIFYFVGKFDSVSFEGVDLAFGPSDWLFGHRNLGWYSLMANLNRSDVAL